MSNPLLVPGVILLLLALLLLVIRLTARNDRSVRRFMSGASLICLGMGMYVLCGHYLGLIAQMGMGLALTLMSVGGVVILYSLDTKSRERGAMFSDDGRL